MDLYGIDCPRGSVSDNKNGAEDYVAPAIPHGCNA